MNAGDEAFRDAGESRLPASDKYIVPTKYLHHQSPIAPSRIFDAARLGLPMSTGTHLLIVGTYEYDYLLRVQRWRLPVASIYGVQQVLKHSTRIAKNRPRAVEAPSLPPPVLPALPAAPT